MKIVSTFVTVMLKYIICILLGTFLMWGIDSVPDKDVQESRIETGATVDVQHFSIPNHCEAQAVMQPGLTRTITPLKVLKFNPTSLTTHILRALNSQLSVKDRANLAFKTNITRYSYRYYIYTLERMLI